MKILQGKQKEMLSVYYQQINVYLKAKACKIFQELFTLFFFFKEILIYSTVIYMS